MNRRQNGAQASSLWARAGILPAGAGSSRLEARRPHRLEACATRPSAFTFVEVLAAMAFLGILLPVLVSALLVSSRAGSLAERSTVALQLGENRLNEMTIGDAWGSAESSGDFGKDWPGYQWELTQADWQNGEMTVLTLTVHFTVQGHNHDVRLSTLVAESPTEAL